MLNEMYVDPERTSGLASQPVTIYAEPGYMWRVGWLRGGWETVALYHDWSPGRMYRFCLDDWIAVENECDAATSGGPVIGHGCARTIISAIVHPDVPEHALSFALTGEIKPYRDAVPEDVHPVVTALSGPHWTQFHEGPWGRLLVRCLSDYLWAQPARLPAPEWWTMQWVRRTGLVPPPVPT